MNAMGKPSRRLHGELTRTSATPSERILNVTDRQRDTEYPVNEIPITNNVLKAIDIPRFIRCDKITDFGIRTGNDVIG